MISQPASRTASARAQMEGWMRTLKQRSVAKRVVEIEDVNVAAWTWETCVTKRLNKFAAKIESEKWKIFEEETEGRELKG